ncbi:ComF family protein [Lentisphaerota bacterium WC36G]|nr:ComF family protein [Lentisphaerae bacterium WC36]
MTHFSLKAICDSFIAFPCPLCKKVSENNLNNGLCDDCKKLLCKIALPYCHGCGGTNKGFLAVCEKCIKGLDRPWNKIIAVYEYDYLAGKMLRNLKYNDSPHLIKGLMPHAIERINEEQLDIDVIIPIPLHFSRLLWRGFNQSELIARELLFSLKKTKYKKCQQIKIISLLKRKSRTKVQMTLDKEQRLENVQNVFDIKKGFLQKSKFSKDSNILLVDDVLTTGATLKFATEILRKSGFKNINVLVLARR